MSTMTDPNTNEAKRARTAIARAAAALRGGTPKSAPTEGQMRAALRLDEALDDVEWIEKGLAEWRATALANGDHARATEASLRIAIGHLHAVLNKSRTHAEQQAADTAARDWLTSIGSEPT